MRLTQSNMLRVYRRELTPGEAFALQEIADDPGQQTQTATVALVTQTCANWFGNALREACNRAGLPLAIHRARKEDYSARRKAAKNLITWGVKWPSHLLKRGRRNVLFLENGLFDQRSGAYIDHQGYFCDSSIVTESQQSPTAREVAAIQSHVRKRFGWDWFSGGDPSGPVLLVLQTPRDCSVRFHYSPLDGGRGAARTLIEETARHLPPEIPVAIRQHPRQSADLAGIGIPDGWTIDDGKPIAERLPECRAVVTISSTVATEALALGLPVACFGRSAWEGSGAVLECARDPSQVARLATWRSDEWNVLRYLAAVMRHQLPYGASADQIAANPSFREWAKQATQTDHAKPLKAQAEEAWQAIQESGNDAAIELGKAINAKAGQCCRCQHSRLQRQMIDLAESLA